MERANPRELTFVKGILDALLDQASNAKLREERFKAIHLAKSLTDKYAEWGIRNDLLDVIMQKKTNLILAADSISDIQRAAKPPKPRHNGATWIEDPFTVPEEELVLWLQMSLERPPSEIAHRRITKLFTQTFGISAEDLGRNVEKANDG